MRNIVALILAGIAVTFWTVIFAGLTIVTQLFLLLNFALRRAIRAVNRVAFAVHPAYAMEGSGLNSRGIHVFQTGLTFGAVATVTATEQSMVVPTLPAQIPLAQCAVFGSRLGAPQAGACIAHCRVIDSTHIGVTWVNPTAGPVTPTAAETFTFVLIW